MVSFEGELEGVVQLLGLFAELGHGTHDESVGTWLLNKLALGGVEAHNDAALNLLACGISDCLGVGGHVGGTLGEVGSLGVFGDLGMLQVVVVVANQG